MTIEGDIEADALEAVAKVIADMRACALERPLLPCEVETLADAVKTYRAIRPAPRGAAPVSPALVEALPAHVELLRLPLSERHDEEDARQAAAVMAIAEGKAP